MSPNAMDRLQAIRRNTPRLRRQSVLNTTQRFPFSSLPSSFIQPRHFNHIAVHHTSSIPMVFKTSSDPSLRAELFFYQNIPTELFPYFPKLMGHFEREQNNETVLTIALEYIAATNMSDILTSGRLTKEHIQVVLQTLFRLHITKSMTTMDESVVTYNYIPKICERYTRNKSLYLVHGITKADIDVLCSYLCEHKPLRSNMIHGDPVFTNILSNGIERSVVFLDMRGAQGHLLTTCGDVYYDLAKVLQSLCGYDHILKNLPFEFTYHFLLLNSFFDQVSILYPIVSRWSIVLITASLFISLIPLHQDVRARKMYALMGKKHLRWLHSWRGEEIAEGAFCDLAELTQQVLQHRHCTPTAASVTDFDGFDDIVSSPVSLLEVAETLH